MRLTTFFFYTIFILALAIVTSGCAELKDVSLKKVENARIVKMGTDGIEAELDVRISNPNRQGFNIYKSELDIALNGNSLGKAYITDKVKIKGNSEQVYTFKIKTKLKDAASAGLTAVLALAAGNTANIHLKGSIKAGKFYYKKEFPIDTKQRIPFSK